MAIINNYNFKNPQIRIIRDEYWDFVLSPDNTPIYNNDDLIKKCLISYIDIEDDKCVETDDKIFSLSSYCWDEAKNEGVELTDIGLTGIDNGFINFRKDRISNEEFYNILINSKLEIEKNDIRLFLTPITGNTLEYSYPYKIYNNNEKYIELKGGFFQGFFKLFGIDYQTLPSFIDDTWHFEFVLRKQDYETENNILNAVYPENKGIFFYMGTRAENKFWRFYNINSTQFEDNKKIIYNEDGYFENKDYLLNRSEIIYTDYFGEDPEEDKVITDKNYLAEPGYINDKDCQLQSKYDFSLDPYVIWDDENICSDGSERPCGECDKYIKPKKIIPNITNYFLNEYGYATSNTCPCKCKDKVENVKEKNIVNNEVNNKKCGCITGMITPITKAGFPNPYWTSRFETDICVNQVECEKKIPKERCKCDSYFIDGYFDEFNNGCCETVGYLADENYFLPEVSLKDIKVITSEGHEMNKNGYYEIISDNKFLLFNQTLTGYTTNNWKDGLSIAFTGRTSSFKGNYYLLMNHTQTGYTIDTIDKYLAKYENTYNVINDIVNNAFALKINDDNSIGYKYLIKDCNDEKKYNIIEEKSKPNIILDKEWTTINIKIKVITGTLNKCNLPVGKRKIKIYFYVNGNLIFISKELPEFNFKELNDVFDKQEGVPFNISLGGGTQGLCETLWLNYYELPEKILPLEKNFAGTFIGDIKSFKFYNCPLTFKEIKNNFIYEKFK